MDDTTNITSITLNTDNGLTIHISRSFCIQSALAKFRTAISPYGAHARLENGQVIISTPWQSGLNMGKLLPALQQFAADIEKVEEPILTKLQSLGESLGIEPSAVEQLFKNAEKKSPQGLCASLDIANLKSPTSATTITKNSLYKAMQTYTQRYGNPAAWELLKKFNVYAISDLPEAKHMEFYVALMAGPEAPKPKLRDIAPEALKGWDFISVPFPQMANIVFNVVGQHFRSARAQEVLANKVRGNIALVVPELDNEVDKDGLMVLMWDSDNRVWAHVGYVRKIQAHRFWRTPNIENNKRTLRNYVFEATIVEYPMGASPHGAGPNIRIELSGQTRHYNNYPPA